MTASHIQYYLLLIGLTLIGLLDAKPVFSQQPQPTLPSFLSDSLAKDSSESKRIRIINSDVLSYERKNGESIQKLIGNVIIWHDTTLFYCDSAYHFEDLNRLEAYDHVKVIMQDSVTLTGDKLIYYSETKVAEIFDNITLTDGGTVLTTNKLVYKREEDFGYYEEGGKLVDGENELTSTLGYYYPQEKMAYFKDSVVLVSPDYTLRSDTLGYNTELKIANFLSLTYIDGKDGKIETRLGNYDTQLRRVNLFSRSLVNDSTYTMEADTIFYDDEEYMGYAQGKVIVQQADSSMEIRGEYGEFNRSTDESMVTQNPVAIQIFDSDTLYLFADTLFSITEKKINQPALVKPALPDSVSAIPDSLRDKLVTSQIDSVRSDSIDQDTPLLPDSTSTTSSAQELPGEFPDSLPVLPGFLQDSLTKELESVSGQDSGRDTSVTDTIRSRVFKAYNKVQFFMNDMQGRADSMVYFFDDSIIYLYHNPILWSDENQLTGDTIIIWMKNGKADSMWIGPNAFLASKEDTVGYNQLKGKEMRAKFKDNSLEEMHVIGNSESIYFAKNDEDSANVYYEGMNQALAQEMILYFRDNEIKKILFLASPEGTFYPFFEIVFKDNKLDGMRWRIEEKPEKPDIFKPVPQPERPPGLLPPPIQEAETSSLPLDGENR